MSLTSNLKDPKSNVSQFLRREFPNVREVMKLSRARAKEFSLDTILPEGNVDWSIIGQAIDYRIRFYFPQEGARNHVEDLVAYDGAECVCKVGYLSDTVASCFFDELETFVADTKPARRRLDTDEEDKLLKFCVVLAAFDVFVRCGLHSSILFKSGPKNSVEELLAVAELHWLDDLRRLSWGFYDTQNQLLYKHAVLNPTFFGSGWVGGADADLIVEDCLVDVKTTKNLLKETDWIFQLLGYTLLDFHDGYQIRNVAIYFARQQFFLLWSLDELMAHLTGSTAPDLKVLRKKWRDAIIGEDVMRPKYSL